MKSTLIILIVFFLLTVSQCADQPRKVDKVMIGCGSACPRTCKHPEPRICIQVCTGEPECPEDYYENDKGECVLLEDC